MKALMKMILVLLACVSFQPVLAEPSKAPEGPSVADTVKQLARDWADAMIAVDIDKVSQIVADDWIDGFGGKVVTKASLLSHIKSRKNKLETCEFGPMDVMVLGNVAVLQGSVAEKQMKDGQLHSSRVAFMDVFMKRGDRWVVVRSQSTKL